MTVRFIERIFPFAAKAKSSLCIGRRGSDYGSYVIYRHGTGAVYPYLTSFPKYHGTKTLKKKRI